MIGKYILYIISIISLFWIGYVGMDIIDKENEFLPEHLFGLEDGQICIINRLDENPLKEIAFKTTPDNQITTEKLIPWLKKESQIIISKNQNHFFIDNKENWNEEKIKKLFHNAGLSIEFTSYKSFKSGNYNGKYTQSVLYIYGDGVSNPNKPLEWNNYDKKASASIVTFHPSGFSNTDYYIKEGEKFEYSSSISNKIVGRQIDDQDIFSPAIPNNTLDYHFLENEFAASSDIIFMKNPMNQWCEYGFVEFNIDDSPVIISDYKNGQNPILILNDLKNNEDEVDENKGYFTGIRLTKSFPENPSKGFYIKRMDDYVVISPSENTCNKVIADYRLGNTIAMKKDKLNYFFDNLPRKVSERTVSKEKKSSKTIYKNKLLTTQVGNKEIDSELSSEILSLSIHIDSDIEDFKVLPGKGNIIVLTKNATLLGFSNAKKIWQKKLDGYPFGKIKDLPNSFGNPVKYLITTSKEIHLIDQNGNEENNFPIALKTKATCEATPFTLRGTKCVAVGTEKNEIAIYNFKGKNIYNLKTGLTLINRPIDIWTSKNIVFAGAKDEYQYVMLNIEKKKEYRKFKIPNLTWSLNLKNELFQYTFENDALIKINQKGEKESIKKFPGGKIIAIRNEVESPQIIMQAGNEIVLYTPVSETIKRQRISFGQLDDLSILNSKNIIGVIDGIGNNIYLFDSNGQINKKALEGKQIIHLSENGNKTIVSTIVDEYIIQYTDY